MTNCHDVREQLSLLMDGQLSEADRAAIEAHLDVCESCRGLRQDLQRLKRAATSLGPIAPPDHVWLQIAGQVRMEPRAAAAVPQSSHPRAALRQWVELAAALVVVTVGAYYFLRATPPPEAPGNAQASGTVEAIAEELSLASQHYERAIAELQALAEADSGALDPKELVRGVVEQTREIILLAFHWTTGEYHLDPADALAIAHRLTARVALRHDYHRADFTMHMYREAQVS